MESTEEWGVGEEKTWVVSWSAMEAGGGTVAGRDDGGTDPERGEADKDGGRRATLEGEGSRGALAVECGCGLGSCVGFGGTGGMGS